MYIDGERLGGSGARRNYKNVCMCQCIAVKGSVMILCSFIVLLQIICVYNAGVETKRSIKLLQHSKHAILLLSH